MDIKESLKGLVQGANSSRVGSVFDMLSRYVADETAPAYGFSDLYQTDEESAGENFMISTKMGLRLQALKCPFSKFALIENFWETGYGMPSFTLLGEQVIRFPFILESSYPHEILHNWWGNGVYPDYTTGNWSEGLTAYLADHLFQEMDGLGAEYRKEMLSRYKNYVSTEWISLLRNSPLETQPRHKRWAMVRRSCSGTCCA